MLTQDQEDFIESILKNSNVKSIARTWTKIKQQGNPYNVTLKLLKEYLQSLESVQVHTKNKIVNSYVAHKPRQEYQIDITWIKGCNYEEPGGMVINQLKNPKKVFIYALTCIDIFTKYADLVIMKSKSTAEVITALKKILKRMGKPDMIYCDDGTEFTSGEFKNFCADQKIELVFANSHAPVIERWHRTLKEMLTSYFDDTDSKTLTPDVLFSPTGVITEYNKSLTHSTTKMTPTEAKQEENKEEVHKNILAKSSFKKREVLKVGDKVRVLLKVMNTQKGYAPKWSKEVHTVDAKEGRYFIINDTIRRRWLRHALLKIGEKYLKNK